MKWCDLRMYTYEGHNRQLAMGASPGAYNGGRRDPDINFEIKKGYYIFMSQYKEWNERHKKFKN